MDYLVCDEFLMPDAQPCGAVVVFPEQHRAWHLYLEKWIAWAAQAGTVAYKKDKDKPDNAAPPETPEPPDTTRY